MLIFSELEISCKHYKYKYLQCKNLQASTLRHISSSTEDLILLFEAEREAVQMINYTRNHGSLNGKFKRIIEKYFQLIDYNM